MEKELTKEKELSDDNIKAKKKAIVDQMLENKDVKERVDQEIESKSEEKAEEKAKLLIKRNEFLNTLDSNPLNSLKKYSVIAEDDYIDLKDKMAEIRRNISSTSMEDLDRIKERIKSVMKVEGKLSSRANTYDISPSHVEDIEETTPKGLTEILKDPERYSDYIDQEISGKRGKLTIYKTQLDDEKVDMNLLGNRSDKTSVKEMNRLEDSLEDVLARNMPYRHFQEIK